MNDSTANNGSNGSNGGSSGDNERVAIAALVVAGVAFFTAVAQLFQAIVASAKGLPNCDKRVMGRWAHYTSRRFVWRELRLEVGFEAPVIFLSPADNPRGPAGRNVPIWYANGTKKSCDDTRVDEPRSDGLDDDLDKDNGAFREPVHTVNNELATWVKLLSTIQKMERDSLRWETGRWRSAKLTMPDLEVPSLAVGIQATKRSFDANPTVKRPYATTTICHIVELAAVLGLYWKEFNRDENKYRAEGNGLSLLGTRVDDFGIQFVFEKSSWSKFQETRLIPTNEVKELCFGNAPTIYRVKDRVADEAWNAPISSQKTFQTLQLGSRKEIADTLNMIGCNTTTTLYFLHDKKQAHLFPVPFEILGMLGRTLHIYNRCFTYLPNPTILPWNRQRFSLRRMLDEFHTHISQEVAVLSRQDFPTTLELGQIKLINTLASSLSKQLPGQKGDFEPQHLNKVHDALKQLDELLHPDQVDKDIVLDVLRRHLQEVLLAINTTADQAAGRAPPSTPVALADISFDDLLSVPPENREREFVKKYFNEIRIRVVSTDSTDHHDPPAADASLTIHKEKTQEKQKQEVKELENELKKENSGEEKIGESPEQSSPPVPPASPPMIDTLGGLGLRMGPKKLSPALTWDKLSSVYQGQRNNIWCTLVLRMILWLLLHDFDKHDIQVSKSELIGSRQPVYVM